MSDNDANSPSSYGVQGGPPMGPPGWYGDPGVQFQGGGYGPGGGGGWQDGSGIDQFRYSGDTDE